MIMTHSLASRKLNLLCYLAESARKVGRGPRPTRRAGPPSADPAMTRTEGIASGAVRKEKPEFSDIALRKAEFVLSLPKSPDQDHRQRGRPGVQPSRGLAFVSAPRVHALVRGRDKDRIGMRVVFFIWIRRSPLKSPESDE